MSRSNLLLVRSWTAGRLGRFRWPLPDQREPAAIAQGSEIWICDDGSPLAPALRANLERLGHHVRLIAPEGSPLPDPALNFGALIILAPAVGGGDGVHPKCVPAGSRRRSGAAEAGCAGRGRPALRSRGWTDRLAWARAGSRLRSMSPAARWRGWSSPRSRNGRRSTARPWTSIPAFDSAQAAAEQIVQELFRRGPAEVGLSGFGPPGDRACCPSRSHEKSQARTVARPGRRWCSPAEEPGESQPRWPSRWLDHCGRGWPSWDARRLRRPSLPG